MTHVLSAAFFLAVLLGLFVLLDLTFRENWRLILGALKGPDAPAVPVRLTPAVQRPRRAVS